MRVNDNYFFTLCTIECLTYFQHLFKIEEVSFIEQKECIHKQIERSKERQDQDTVVNGPPKGALIYPLTLSFPSQ